MMYDERFVAPMRAEITQYGVEELKTAAAVDEALTQRKGTQLLIVNSICGCAARNMRPAVGMALQHAVTPDHKFTVFAGNDADATRQARGYFTGYAPSSPSIGLLKDGKLVHMVERWQIEGRSPEVIAEDLKSAFDKHCAPAAV
ncbi:MAG TPA: BrxA/BrxB family bacilliredoxin [Gemmatimonadaceae bacterium]|nr:BrxA/BrxB family bacilliredoxin [Gemmatimonadaceae bacterium]HRQ79421.1 BrxA/BrxB family bacilliredoxin [Gemmatimonadaceae bacterium]